jgi:uncharacterized protein YqcC (DUF446 family)
MSREVVFLLKELEFTLQRLQLWQDETPSDEALASTQPFALDTLAFHQWLQFILLARFRAMLAAGEPLPSAVSIYPMATEVYKEQTVHYALLLDVLARLDEALSGKPIERLQ